MEEQCSIHDSKIKRLLGSIEFFRRSSDELVVLHMKCIERLRRTVTDYSAEREKLESNRDAHEKSQIMVDGARSRLVTSTQIYANLNHLCVTTQNVLKRATSSVKTKCSRLAQASRANQVLLAENREISPDVHIYISNSCTVAESDLRSQRRVDIQCKYACIQARLKEAQRMLARATGRRIDTTRVFYVSTDTSSAGQSSTTSLINDKLRYCQSAAYPVEQLIELIGSLLYELHHQRSPARFDRDHPK